jgi:ribosomal protein S18 acetylase RimI-like enzyme
MHDTASAGPLKQSPLQLRAMTSVDIPLGMRLKDLAGWNQTPADWEMLLHCGLGWVAEYTGVPVGTATLVTYAERFGWIGMVLVDPAYRRRGIGTALLDVALVGAAECGIARLDATPLGVSIYTRRGFQAECELVRMLRQPQRLSEISGPPTTAPSVVPLAMTDLDHLAALDSTVFGADRRCVLADLLQRASSRALCVRQGSELVGFCLARPGAHYSQVGPLVAKDRASAELLLAEALMRSPGPVIVDVPEDNQAWVAHLKSLGFVVQRRFLRMYQGGRAQFGLLVNQYAMAGPEIG